MAQFNPQLNPTNDPNYLGMSHPISQPEPNRTLSSLFSGIGNIFENTVKAEDLAKKHQIDENLYRDLSYERDLFTQGVEQLRGPVGPQQMRGTRVGPGVTSYTDEETPPAALENLPQQITNTQEALRAGKISPSYYYQQLNSIAKQYRNQYPGYREYIDQRISEITGVNPANRYLQSIIQDLAASGTSDKADHNRILTQSMKHIGAPGADKMINGFRQGRVASEEMIKWLNRLEQNDYRRKEVTESVNFNKLTTGEQKRMAREGFIRTISDTAWKHMTGIKINNDLGTPEDINNLIQRIARGEQNIDNEQYVQIVNGVNAAYLAARQELVKIGTRDVNPHDNKTLLDRYGDRAELDKDIENGLSDFKELTEAVTRKDWGLAANKLQTFTLMTEEGASRLMNDPIMGKYMRMMVPMHKVMPNAATELIKGIMTAAGADFAKDTRKFVEANIGVFLGQPDLKTSGKVHTATDSVKNAKGLGIKEPRVYEEFINAGKMLTNPKIQNEPEAMKGLIQTFFSERNVGLVDEFKMDQVVEIPGQGVRSVPGKYAVMLNLTTPEIASAVKKFSDANGPQYWQMYENWTLQSFAKLFGRDVRDLKDIATYPGVTIVWNQDNKRLSLDKRPELRPGFTGNVFDFNRDVQRMESTINRLNSGISRLKNISETSGGDVEAYILQEMIKNGFNPAEGKVRNAAEGVLNAITSIQKRKAFERQQEKNRQKTPKAEGF